MRRWIAISGLCHFGLLLALTLWLRASAPPPERSPKHVFLCVDASKQTVQLEPRVSEPAESAVEEPALEDPVEIEDFWRDASAEPEVRVEEEFEVQRSHVLPRRRELPAGLGARLRRPLRTQAKALAQREVKRKPAAPVAAGATHGPALLSTKARIPYPRRARRRGVEGTVVLRIWLDRTGRVTRVEVVESSGSVVLDDAAKAGAERWRFVPAMRNGMPIADWTTGTVRFELAVKVR